MTQVEYLAALLSPRSVSPHPNFRSVDRVTPAGLLGLVVSGDRHESADLEDRLAAPLSDFDDQLIRSASESISAQNMASGASRLAELATVPSAPDAAFRVAAALLAATALSEMDQPGDAVELLGRVAALVSDDTDDGRLLLSAVWQQQALRASEAGIAFEEARDRARDYLQHVDALRVSRYPTSDGSRWPAATTNRNIARALQGANQDLFDAAVGFPGTKTLKRWLRTPDAPLIGAMIRHAGTGQNEFIRETFSSYAMSAEQSVRNQDPVDHPVWRSLMFFELLGHRRLSRHYRVLLGELRILRAHGHPETSREGLRLLRQGGDAKKLKLALGLVRAGGPLESLTNEGQAIVRHRVAPELLRDVELATLDAAAQLLSDADADKALMAVLAALNSVPIATPFRRELPSIQMENLFRAAASLAPVAQRATHLVATVLDSVERIGPTEDQLLVRAHQRALQPIEWDEVGDQVKDRWRAWLDDPDSPRWAGWEPLANMVAPELRSDDDPLSEAAETNLDRVAHELNVLMAASGRAETARVWLRDTASHVVADLMATVRRDAANGMFSMYSFEPADLAVALCQHADADLWGPVTDFLLDPNVPRSVKSSALDRIAATPESVPDSARTQFESNGVTLFASRHSVSPFDPPEIEPFPSAVRVLSALRVFSGQDQLAAVAVLSAGSTASKLEAARTLSVVVSDVEAPPEWALAIALQLSSDANANVRAETGRTLALALSHSEFARGLVETRLLKLLNEDGILVPLLVLRGLMSDVEIPPGALRQQVETLAEGHRVFGVRTQARFVLER
jgi:hypothetical protein